MTSPKKEGNTYLAIKMITSELEKEGIDTKNIHLGDKSIRGVSSVFSVG